jgi:hypothetical protein
VLESDGKYFLLSSDPAPPEVTGSEPQPPVVFYPSKPVNKGRLYGIDGNGKLLWPAPVKIEAQGFPSYQPADLPILTFVKQVGRLKTSVLCIDKRDGRTVYQANNAGDLTNFFRVVGDAKKKTVDLMNWASIVTLTFTDKP